MSQQRLKPVHVKNKNKSGIVEHNPIRQFVGYGPRGLVFQYQGGNWFNALGAPLAVEDVPADVLALVKNEPLRSEAIGPRVAEVCDHCGETFYQDPTLKEHLLEVWKQATEAASVPAHRVVPVEPQPDTSDVPPSASALG